MNHNTEIPYNDANVPSNSGKNAEDIAKELLKTPIGTMIREILLIFDVDDCWIGGEDKTGGLILSKNEGGHNEPYELPPYELPPQFAYLVLTVPKRSTYPPGIHQIHEEA